MTPYQRYEGKDITIILQRDILYKKARNCNPERWSKNTRNWKHQKEVQLNPANEDEIFIDEGQMAA
ncbi:MAG: hypothetical protein OCC45_15400 [Desulfotalea sp.]